MAQTLTQIIAKIANQYGIYVTGAVDAGGSTTTLVDVATLIYPDNALVNHYLYMLGGTYANLERRITANSQDQARVTFNPAFAGAVTLGDTFEIKPLPHADFVDAVQTAIRAAEQTWLKAVLDTTSVTFSGAGNYSLPADTVNVTRVWVQSPAGEWKPVNAFEVSGPLGTKKLIVHDYALALASGTAKIEYTALPTMVSALSDTLGLDDVVERQCLDFVYEYALAHLHRLAFSRNPTGESARAHLTAAQMHYQLAMAVKAQANPNQRVVRMVNAPETGEQV